MLIANMLKNTKSVGMIAYTKPGGSAPEELIAPRKYVQGRGVLAEIGTYLAMLGRRPLLLWDETVK